MTSPIPVNPNMSTELIFPMQSNRWRREPRRKHQAFTLVEMLLVLVILAVLAAIVIPKFSGRSQQAKITAAQSDISGMEVALDAFEVDNGFYPQGSAGLNALVDQPSNSPSWKGPYLKSLRADPWGNPYVYTYPGRNNAKGYDLMSMGPDGRSGGDDDITNWADRK
jgi:general secretion pathway protein G